VELDGIQVRLIRVSLKLFIIIKFEKQRFWNLTTTIHSVNSMDSQQKKNGDDQSVSTHNPSSLLSPHYNTTIVYKIFKRRLLEFVFISASKITDATSVLLVQWLRTQYLVQLTQKISSLISIHFHYGPKLCFLNTGSKHAEQTSWQSEEIRVKIRPSTG